MSDDIVVQMGRCAVARDRGRLVALGLGSCVAVIAHDPVGRVGGLLHVVLPAKELARDRTNPARTAETGVPFLLQQVVAAGARRERLVARLVGGATMFADLLPRDAVHIGERNVRACREALRAAGVPVVAEAVGGQAGRSVWFDVGLAQVTVRTAGAEPAGL